MKAGPRQNIDTEGQILGGQPRRQVSHKEICDSTVHIYRQVRITALHVYNAASPAILLASRGPRFKAIRSVLLIGKE